MDLHDTSLRLSGFSLDQHVGVCYL